MSWKNSLAAPLRQYKPTSILEKFASGAVMLEDTKKCMLWIKSFPAPLRWKKHFFRSRYATIANRKMYVMDKIASGAVTLEEAFFQCCYTRRTNSCFYVMENFAAGAVGLEEANILLYVMAARTNKRFVVCHGKIPFLRCNARRSKMKVWHGKIRFWRRYTRRRKREAKHVLYVMETFVSGAVMLEEYVFHGKHLLGLLRLLHLFGLLCFSSFRTSWAVHLLGLLRLCICEDLLHFRWVETS